ncbi:MAG: N-acetylneuraminate synthase [Desulfobacteraceae bacterium]|nr:MAG: N-acetylneuraminate synthase [Desulfobacteraceae bacterium]
MDRKIEINRQPIGDGQPVYFIAEVGINHNGDARIAEKLIRAAARSGVNAVKFQTYITEKRIKQDSPIFAILKKCELSFKVQANLKAFAEAEGVTFFSTPFDTDSVDFLTGIDVPAFKIASFELVNLMLVRKIASAGKPVIASRGMACRSEIDAAVDIFTENHVPYALLHCVSAYPTALEDVNLNVIRNLGQLYPCPIGYSDHTLGIHAPVIAVAVGARIIEKHFTLDRNMEGPDHSLSVDPGQMSDMIRNCREVNIMCGEGRIDPSKAEAQFFWLRRPSD